MRISEIKNFFENSYKLLKKYSMSGRYYHTICPSDNSPVVIHKETNQITYVIKGNGSVFLDDKEKKLRKGDIILVNAGATHQFFAKSPEMTLFHIHIPDEGRDNDRYIVRGDDYDRYKP